MRQPSIIILVSIIFLLCNLQAQSEIRGKIEYSIPIDYSKLSKKELDFKGHEYFYLASKYKDGYLSEEATQALNIYSILQHVDPENPDYCVKQGVLFDKLKKDRQAKGCFSRAISIDNNYADAYFEFGNFYYKRENYRRAENSSYAQRS